MTTYRPPGLSDRERHALDRLAKKERLTDMEVGQLAWYALAGNKSEATKAQRRIRKHKKETKK